MKNSVLILFFAIFSGTNCFTIHCDFRNTTWNYIGEIYYCRTNTTVLPSSNHTVTQITGTHHSGRNNSDVQGVRIDNNFNLPFVPRGFTKFFPNMIAYYMYRTTIDNLDGDELYEFGDRLKLFGIYYGNLTSIPSRLFDARPKLVFIRFYSNKIDRVGWDLFTPLNTTLLREVDFNNNRCISRWAVNNQTAIRQLIDDLRTLCPYEDEITTTTTTTTTTTASSTTTTLSTTTGDFCFDGSISDFVCELDETVSEVKIGVENANNQLNQTQSIVNDHRSLLNETISELTAAKAKIDELTGANQRLNSTVADLQNEIAAKDERIESIEGELTDQKEKLEWLELEVLRLSASPCFCN